MTDRLPNILVIDDDESIRKALRLSLKDDYAVSEAASGKAAIAKLMKEPVDLVLLDLKLPDTDGMKLLKEIKRIDDTVNVIMITADNTVRTAVGAMKQGAYDFVTKPFNIDELTILVGKALEKTRIQKENMYLKASASRGNGEIIGRSEKTKELIQLIDDIADSPSTVHVFGETGVGKELVARAIHRRSKRCGRLFVPVNCAAIPENLLESELFGHEKGAFTGAVDRYIGKFEIADGGTLFLDEVGSLPPAMQAKLLRVLQDKIIERLGGEKPITVDSRIISATNSDLKKAVEQGKFREDLYYRLNVIPVHVPALRERKDDIAPLALHFIKKYCSAFGKKPLEITKGALSRLTGYDWPGNIRELENLIERFVVLSKGLPIEEKSLPAEITGGLSGGSCVKIRSLSLREATRHFEKNFIEEVMKKAGGSKVKAAKMLGVHRNTLLQLEKKLK